MQVKAGGSIRQLLKELKAKNAGLCNLFLPNREYGYGLTNLALAEILGRSRIASEVFN